jgi:hypothetical protein
MDRRKRGDWNNIRERVGYIFNDPGTTLRFIAAVCIYDR